MKKKRLKRLIQKELGGCSKVARQLGVSAAAVSKWTRIPVMRVHEVAALSGGKYRPEDLRPDIFREAAQP